MLRALPGVLGLSREKEFGLALNYSSPLIGAPTMWNVLGGASHAGEGVKIAILDSGIYTANPFFNPGAFSYPLGYPKGDARYTTPKVIAARAYFRADDPPDEGEPANPTDGSFSHGTHVAGIAAGNANTTTPRGKMSGIAPRAWLMNYKLFYRARSQRITAFTPEILAALEDAVADGADIVNGSWGGAADFLPAGDPLVLATEALVRAGVVGVFAAGNQGPNAATINSPAIAPSVIAVGSTTTARDGGTPNVVSASSSCGPGMGLSLKPDLVAPGQNIYSSYNSYFTSLTGTSMATPHVAGAAALLLQLHPDWSPAQCKSALMTTAYTGVTVFSWDGPIPVGPLGQGAGRMDLAVAHDPGLWFSPPSASWGEVRAGETVTLTIGVASLAPLGAAGERYTVTVEGPAPTAGVLLSAAPDTLLLGGQEQAILTLRLEVASGATPADYGGRVWLVGAGRRLHVPWWVRVLPSAPQADILLLDDDASSLEWAPDYLPYYTALCDELGLSYEVWDVGLKWQEQVTQYDLLGALPTAAQLKGYRAVVWFTGDSTAPSAEVGAPGPDRSTVLDYLQSNGRLLVTGQDFSGYAGGASNGDSANLTNIGLGAEIVVQDAYAPAQSPAPAPLIAGVYTDPAFAGFSLEVGAASALTTTLSAGAGNQQRVDEIAPLLDYDARAILRVLLPGSQRDGIVAVAKAAEPTLEEPLPIMPPGRAVYLAFGLEGVSNDPTQGYTTRRALFERIWEWLQDEIEVSISDGAAANPYDLVTLRAQMTTTLPMVGARRFRWDLGDGSPILTTQQPSVAYAYQQAGTYHPRVEVMSTLGHKVLSRRATVTVTAPPGPAPEKRYSYLPLVIRGEDDVETARRLPGHAGQVGAPDFQFSSKSVDKSETLPGDLLSYTIVAFNSGTAAATLQVRDLLPHVAGLVLHPESLMASQGEALWYPAQNDGYGLVFWQGEIGSGQSVAISLQVSVGEDVPVRMLITNHAYFREVSSGAQWSDEATTLLIGPDIGSSRKEVDKALVAPGELLTYRLVAANSGNLTTTMQVSDTLPQVGGLQLVEGSLQATQGRALWQPLANEGYGAITWQATCRPRKRSRLPTRCMSSPMRSESPGLEIVNQALFTDETLGRALTQTVTTSLQMSDLSRSDKRADRSAVLPGETITYTLLLRNTGNLSAQAMVTDTLPHLAVVELVPTSLHASQGVAQWRRSRVSGMARCPGRARWRAARP